MDMQKAKTKALYNSLKSQIISKILLPGTKLPSETELIEQYGVSRYGARKALDALSNEQFIQKHQGKGCFVCQPPSSNLNASINSHQILLIASRAEHFYFLKSISGIEKALQNSGYTLTIKLANYDSAEEALLLKNAFKENYAGLLLFPSKSAYLYTNLHLYRYIETHHIPCITLGNALSFSSLPHVVSDDYAGGCIAANYLIEKGHRHFLCLMNEEEYSGCMRYAGFVGGLFENQYDEQNCSVIWFPHSENSIFHDTKLKANLLSAISNNVTAIFCFNDATAVGLYQLLIRHNFRVPDDISIIGYDDSYLCETNPVPLTALHQNPELAGLTAAKNLIDLIENGSCGQSVSLPPSLTERASVRDRNKR